MNHVVQFGNYGAIRIKITNGLMMQSDLLMKEGYNIRGDNWSKDVVHDGKKIRKVAQYGSPVGIMFPMIIGSSLAMHHI